MVLLSEYTGASFFVHASIFVSTCVQNSSFCQSAGRAIIKSHLVTAIVGCHWKIGVFFAKIRTEGKEMIYTLTLSQTSLGFT